MGLAAADRTQTVPDLRRAHVAWGSFNGQMNGIDVHRRRPGKATSPG
jgi:hypothetical protein